MKKSGNGRLIAGTIFVFFGTFFLLSEFNLIPHWVDFHKLWPVILIIIGVFTLIGATKKKPWKEDWAKDKGFYETTGATTENAPETTSNSTETSPNASETNSGTDGTQTDTDETINK